MNTSKELVLDEKATLTFKLENKRAVASGILETASTTFILLIAVRVFNANPTVKWLVSSGDSIGFLLSPFVVALITSLKLRTTKGAAVFAAFGFIAYLIAALSNNIWLFVVGSMVGACCRTVIIPINTQIYQDNYPDDSRGKLYSKSSFIKLVTTAIFSYVAGRFLELELSFYYLLLLIFSFAHLLSYHLLRKCPGRFIKRNKTSLFQGFQYLKHDSIFRNTLACWMLMGFANLIMLPLRVEYLANPKYHLNLSETYIAILVSVIPSIIRIIITPVWGKLFDRMNFFTLRFVANMGFVIGILSFFTSTSYWGLILGSIFYGIAHAGGDVAWNLWVTKFAPAEKVAEYMSVHVFLTGIRAFFAPLVAFHMIEIYPITTIGHICMGMILLSCVFLVPGFRFKTKVYGRRANPEYFDDIE